MKGLQSLKISVTVQQSTLPYIPEAWNLKQQGDEKFKLRSSKNSIFSS
jgi:hypothetical protein